MEILRSKATGPIQESAIKLINGILYRCCTQTVIKLNYAAAASFVLSCTEEYPLWRGSRAEQVSDLSYIFNFVSEFGLG